ncbi:hypothetical protein M911_14075 [Ectothiorhodospira haloalkaliphila]|uniref:DUF1640 domain-containing protein n=1 Tax=Ectothiorhodospira haloalkaliphila TaxID=421628 RepID=W8KLP7_9GAMM|nr:hypothetical protein [Ectothiorhodospira haloalkaliphila]AHK80088.1 hypothetical protein M911_14075 [Ectothiorhodospira haloalkaliphila]
MEAIEHVERRFPAVNDLATNALLRETELRLQKEIEQLRGDVKQEIEKLRAETLQIEGNLRAEMGRQKVDIIKWTLGALLAHTALILGGMRYFFG